MRSLSFRRRVGLVAIGALLLALVVPSAMGSSRALAQPSSAVSTHLQSAATQYASFAYAIAERVAVVGIGTTSDKASAAAESTCRQKGGGVDCQAIGWWINGWASFALGSGNQWGVGVARSLQTADSLALQRCGSGCHLTMRDGIGNGPSLAWGTDTPLRGNWYVGGYTEGVGDHTRAGLLGRRLFLRRDRSVSGPGR